MQMSPEVARQLFFEGAACICLDVPEGTEIGIDLKSWTVTEKYRGIKMIPPGIHFIHFSARNSYGDSSPKVGFMHDFKRKEILVKKWDPEKEELVDDTNDMSETFRANLKELDRSLGAYPFELYSKWRFLVNKITPQILNKLLPACGMIHSALELSASTATSNEAKVNTKEERSEKSQKPKRTSRRFIFGEENYEDLLPQLKAVEGTELRFSTIPDKWYPEGSTPSEITKHSLDSSYLLEQIMAQHENNLDVLGEIQFAFLCFIIGCSLEAFDHWKKLLIILCSCEEAISKYNDVYIELFNVLHYEIVEVQEDFLVDIVAGNNFVYKLLRKLFRTLHMSEGVSGRLRTKAQRFQEHLTDKFQWDFSDVLEEDEEDQPVVVET